MKKRDNLGLVYFLAFTFLALCVFGGLGFYGDFSMGSVTGSATSVRFNDWWFC